MPLRQRLRWTRRSASTSCSSKCQCCRFEFCSGVGLSGDIPSSRPAFYCEEFGVWSVYEMADRLSPGAIYKYWAHGQDLRFPSVPSACRRSVLPVCLRFVGDRLVFFLKASFVPSGSLLLLVCDSDLCRDIRVFAAQ